MSVYTHEWLCQQIIDSAPEAVIFADRDGLIRLRRAIGVRVGRDRGATT